MKLTKEINFYKRKKYSNKKKTYKEIENKSKKLIEKKKK